MKSVLSKKFIQWHVENLCYDCHVSTDEKPGSFEECYQDCDTLKNLIKVGQIEKTMIPDMYKMPFWKGLRISIYLLMQKVGGVRG